MKPKPCPFCGSKNLDCTSGMLTGGSWFRQMTCMGCWASGPRAGDVDEAIAAWNRREEKP